MSFDFKKAAAHVSIHLTSETTFSGEYMLSKDRSPSRFEIYEAIVGMFEAHKKGEDWEAWLKRWLQEAKMKR